MPDAKAGVRYQPVTEKLTIIIQKEREQAEDKSGWIFPTPRPGQNKIGHHYSMQTPFRRAIKAAGMDPDLITPHVLRHIGITKLMEAGVDVAIIQQISGHKIIQMVLRYAHVRRAHMKAAMKLLAVGMETPDKPKSSDTVSPEFHTIEDRKQ